MLVHSGFDRSDPESREMYLQLGPLWRTTFLPRLATLVDDSQVPGAGAR